jgi:GNAT superfamily N-acetyltransferase
MSFNFRIRAAQATDAQTIVDFQIAMAAETEELHLDRSIVTRGVDAVLADSSKGEYWVVSTIVEGDEQIIGGLLVTFEWSDWRNARMVWIQSVYVLPQCRRQGVFRGLLRHIQDLVASRDDWCGVRLYVDNRNEKAQAVYDNLGMNGDHYRVFEWFASDE